MQALILVATKDGPTMLARIGMMRALNAGGAARARGHRRCRGRRRARNIGSSN